MRTMKMMLALVSLLLLAVGGAGCKQAEGERCQIDSDCDDGLICCDESGSGGICKPKSKCGQTPTDAGTDGTVTPEAGTKEAGTPDTGAKEAGTKEAGTKEAGTPDTGTPDTGTPDTGTPDTGATPDQSASADSAAAG